MTSTALTVHYPSYLDIIREKRAEFEKEYNEKLASLAKFQTFYERAIPILKRFEYDRPIDLRINPEYHYVRWSISLLPEDSITLVKPLIEAICQEFDRKITSPYFSPYELQANWHFYDGGSLNIDVLYSREGLTDVKIEETERVTSTVNYHCTSPVEWEEGPF